MVATSAVMTACKQSASNPTTTIVTQEPPKGKMTMRTLGDNMAWLIRCIAAGRAAGIEPPEPEKWIPTHFIS